MAAYTGNSHTTSRIQALEKQREQRQHDVERYRDNIVAATASVIDATTTNKFTTPTDAIDHLLSSDTVGLVTHNDFKARRQYLERSSRDHLRKQAQLESDRNRQNLAKRKLANKSLLSFQNQSGESDMEGEDQDDEEDVAVNRNQNPTLDNRKCSKDDDRRTGTGLSRAIQSSPEKLTETVSSKRRRLGMDPRVDTKFLPDRERELAEKVERERLKQLWLDEQQAIKDEAIKVTYSYWDGAGHRRVAACKKGTTIGRFLAIVQHEFKQLRNTSADSLMFIKEDLIIPHHYSFYDFIVMKARGKSGPLFNFDVIEDVRVVADASKEKEDAHAAKVVERRWYERNRHIFPASRWEVYDPSKKYERYTIHGD